MPHPKYAAAERAIQDLFGDTSVDQLTTREALVELYSLIQAYLDAIDESTR